MNLRATFFAWSLTITFAVGQQVTWTDPATGDTLCSQISSFDLAPGDIPAAWLVATGDPPRRVVHARIVDLLPGCARVRERPPLI